MAINETELQWIVPNNYHGHVQTLALKFNGILVAEKPEQTNKTIIMDYELNQ